MQTRALNGGPNGSPRNRILKILPKETLDKLTPHLVWIDLPRGTFLVEPNHNIRWIYFVESGMASVSSSDLSGTPVEVGIIGREGLVGVHTLLGQRQTQNTTQMQVAGDAYRIGTDILTEQFLLNDPSLAHEVHTFLYAQLEQTTQLVLCNRLHELEARLARWLLMTSDITGVRTLHLTQEFLAEMLGVGRPSVTISAGILQRSGAISYSRGLVELVDTALLENTACECYRVVREARKRAYPEALLAER